MGSTPEVSDSRLCKILVGSGSHFTEDEVLWAMLTHSLQSTTGVWHPYLGNDILTSVASQERRVSLRGQCYRHLELAQERGESAPREGCAALCQLQEGLLSLRSSLPCPSCFQPTTKIQVILNQHFSRYLHPTMLDTEEGFHSLSKFLEITYSILPS